MTAYRIERADGTIDGLGDEIVFETEAAAWGAAEAAWGDDPTFRSWIRVVLVNFGTLVNYETGADIRPATESQRDDSRHAAKVDGGAGVIRVDGVRVFVQE